MPTLELEQAVMQETGLLQIAGVDEAGRGAIAGPVVASAVILPLDRPGLMEMLHEVDDSKRLTATKRERLYELICESSLAIGVGSASAEEIDVMGIIPANARAMQRAIAQLQPAAQYLLLDGRMRIRRPPLPQQSIIRGDSKSLSIAASSILAKVSRDRQMAVYGQQFPEYGFERHKGYCTAGHAAALNIHGPCPIHRRSFAPLRQTLLAEQ